MLTCHPQFQVGKVKKDDGCTVGGESAAGPGFGASKPRSDSPGPGLSPRAGSLLGPPKSGRTICNSSGE